MMMIGGVILVIIGIILLAVKGKGTTEDAKKASKKKMNIAGGILLSVGVLAAGAGAMKARKATTAFSAYMNEEF